MGGKLTAVKNSLLLIKERVNKLDASGVQSIVDDDLRFFFLRY